MRSLFDRVLLFARFPGFLIAAREDELQGTTPLRQLGESRYLLLGPSLPDNKGDGRIRSRLQNGLLLLACSHSRFDRRQHCPSTRRVRLPADFNRLTKFPISGTRNDIVTTSNQATSLRERDLPSYIADQ